jgi:rhodanese-related sulfurtransferase
VAEALRHRGLDVAVVELAEQVLTPLDPEMARAVEIALVEGGVQVRLGAGLAGIRSTEPADDLGVVVDLTDGSSLPADVVLLAMGVRPESGLARAAGLALNPRGAVVVNEHLQTSDPTIYAVGDCVEVVDAVTNDPAMVPLAGPANRQARDAADHLFGGIGRRAPVLGTAIVRVFDVVAATTGKSEKSLAAAGTPYRAVHLHPSSHAGYYPGARPIHLKVLLAPDGRVLGAQATGTEGVDKRIDVIATAIRAGMGVGDLADLELSYAPPFGSAKDPVNLAGMIAENVLDGTVRLWYPRELDGLGDDAVLLDVRTPHEFASGHLPGAVNIPHTALRSRLCEVPLGVPVRIYCASGFRSYLAYRVLTQHGWDDVATLSGGMATLRLSRPDLRLETREPATSRR